MKRSGISTAIREKVSDTIVKPISFDPRRAASSGFMPSSIWRWMFSTTTIASSITKPVAMVSAISVRLLSEKPARYITAKVPTIESGTARLGMSVAVGVRRKRNETAITRPIAIRSSVWTSSIDVRSARIVSFTDPGSDS